MIQTRRHVCQVETLQNTDVVLQQEFVHREVRRSVSFNGQIVNTHGIKAPVHQFLGGLKGEVGEDLAEFYASEQKRVTRFEQKVSYSIEGKISNQ